MLRRTFAAVALAALACAGHAVAAATLAVPPGVRIAVRLASRISSGAARVGDTFAFTTERDATLGDLRIAAGTPGHGRLAVVTPAQGSARGGLALQADSIDLPDGRAVAVNVDPSQPMRGHYANRHTNLAITPLIVVLVPVIRTTLTGDMILEPGTPFTVVTTLPRSRPAPLLTAPPSPAASPPAASPAASPPAASPATIPNGSASP